MRSLHRSVNAVVVGIAAAALAVVVAAPASGAASLPVHQVVYATTRIAKTGMVVTAPKGSFDGSIDLATGNLTGNMTLPPSKMTISLLGVAPITNITFAMEQVGPVHGHVNLTTLQSTTTATFNIRLTKVSAAHADSVNLVGDQCKTSTPITITMSGKAAVATASTFSGSFTIPDFANCRAMTPLFNALIAGPGNTFTATFGPAGTQPPPAPASPGPITPQASVGAHLQAGSQGTDTPPVHIALPLPIPAPAPDTNVFGWLLQTK